MLLTVHQAIGTLQFDGKLSSNLLSELASLNKKGTT